MSTTTRQAVEDWAAAMNGAPELAEALGQSPCEILRTLFPGVAADDDVLGALSALLEPLFPMVGALQMSGAMPPGITGEDVVHDIWHILQIAAALGHAVGTAEALAMAGSLDDIDDIDDPDTFGALMASLSDIEGEAGSEES